MTVTVRAEIDGQVFPVELWRVSGLDALSYRHEVGAELDALILGWVQRGEVPALLADLSVAKWLWTRQNGQPLASLAAVAAGVGLLPAPEQPEPAASDARTIESLKTIQAAINPNDQEPPAGAGARVTPPPVAGGPSVASEPEPVAVGGV